MKLQDISVARKLWVATIAILMAMSVAAVVSHRSTRLAMQSAMDEVTVYEGRITQAVTWKGMTDTNTQRVIANALATDATIPALFAPKLKQGIASISELQKQINETATDPLEKAALAQIADHRKDVLDTLKAIDEMKKGGDTASLGQVVDQRLMPAVTAYLEALDGFIRVEQQLRDSAKAAAAAHTEQVAWLGLSAVGLITLLSLAGVAMLVRSITVPLERAVAASRAIAGGDLTQDLRTNRRDEIGRLTQAMGEMTQRLRSVVAQVRHGVESVSTASSEIATGNMDLSQRTEEQASNLQQTAASMEQLTGTVKQNADNARAASQLAAGATEVATRGGQVVGDVVTTMNDITQSSRRISDIITVIDGIAFQTNILALNAAVEAARAGEQGRGFAVVAGEVRTLAQRSAQAAKEIKSLIEHSVEKVDGGARLVGEAGQTMSDIVSQVRRVSDLVSEISAASVEQARGIEQVGHAVAQLDQVTQQNAALVEESAAAADSMKQQAARLADTVSVFNVGHTSAG